MPQESGNVNALLGEIEWLGELRNVEVIMSESSDSLIGTEMFVGAKLLVDYANRLVTISRDG